MRSQIHVNINPQFSFLTHIVRAYNAYLMVNIIPIFFLTVEWKYQ